MEGAVHPPDQYEVEPPLARVVQELTPGCSVQQVRGRSLVHVFDEGLPALGLDELPQWEELRQGVLVLVGGADPGVEGGLHALAPSRRASTWAM
ncbi:MAG: hypothetical protein HY688_00035 [Chloroflexi bacterium]|nr:hypothetical protein [Chloroflexota bacterium]